MNFDMLNVGNGTFVRADEVNVITRFDYVKIKKEVARLKDGDNSEKLIDAYTEYAFRRNFGKKDVGIQRRIR